MVKIMETPIKVDDLGVPLFSETSIWKNSVQPFNSYYTVADYERRTPFNHSYVLVSLATHIRQIGSVSDGGKQ